jgi:hypothetical protein
MILAVIGMILIARGSEVHLDLMVKMGLTAKMD